MTALPPAPNITNEHTHYRHRHPRTGHATDRQSREYAPPSPPVSSQLMIPTGRHGETQPPVASPTALWMRNYHGKSATAKNGPPSSAAPRCGVGRHPYASITAPSPRCIVPRDGPTYALVPVPQTYQGYSGPGNVGDVEHSPL